MDTALPRFLDHLAQQGGKHHGWRNDGVPVAENEGMNALIVQRQLDGIPVGGRWLTTRDVDWIPRGPKRRNEFFEGRVEIRWHTHEAEAVVYTGIGEQHTRAPRS